MIVELTNAKSVAIMIEAQLIGCELGPGEIIPTVLHITPRT